MRQRVAFWLACIFIVCSLAIEMSIDFDSNDKNALTAAISKAVDEAYDLNKRGLEALDNKQYDAALTAFNEALRIVPEYSDAENNRGVVYFRRGDIAEAQKIWQALAAKDAEYSTASYNLGLIYLHEHQYEAALRLFERSVKVNDRFVEGIVRCGTTHLELGHREKSVELLRKAYKIAPRHPDTWSFLAYSLLVTGDTAEAVMLLKNNESDVKALRLLASIERNRNNSKKASQYLSDAVAKGADPSLLVELSASQAEDGRCSEALSTLKKYFAIRIQHSADAYLTAGIAAKECGTISEAESYFAQGAKRYPSDPLLSYNLGQIYFHQKKYGEAESAWEGLGDSLQDPSLLYLRAVAARQQSDLSQARKMIQKAIALDNRAEFHDFLGIVYHQEKNDQKAEEEFGKALALNPALQSAQLNLALISRKNENLDATAKKLQQQLSSCSGNSCKTLALQLSVVYYHMKKSDKAVAVLISLKDSDKDEQIYRHIALFYRELQAWDKAIAALETAAKNASLTTQTEYELAELYLQSGYYNKAIECFQNLVSKWTENPWRLYYQTGYAWMEQNNLDQAQACFEKSIKSKKDNPPARGLLAYVFNRKGNVTEARKLWQENLREDPGNPSMWINMGLSLERDQKYEEALDHYKKAVQLKPEDKELQINIGNALQGMGRLADAVNAYSQALSTAKRDLAAYSIFVTSMKKNDKAQADKMLAILEKEDAASIYYRRCSAEMALWKGDTAKALRAFESLADKEDADWIACAKIYAARNLNTKARECLSRLSDDPALKPAINAIESQLAFSQGNYAKARQLLQENGDTSLAAQYNIALTAYQAKDYQQALDIARRLSGRATGSDRTDVCRLAGNAAFSLKKWEDAKQWYLQLSNGEANNAMVHYNLAVAFYNLGQMENSWKYYQKAKNIDASIYNKDIEARYGSKGGAPSAGAVSSSYAGLDSNDIWYNSAVDLQQQGRDTAAEKLYKKVLLADSSNALAWNNLGAIYGKWGDSVNAEKSYLTAISVNKKHDMPETYANLVNFYIVYENFRNARKWIIKGLGHNPDNEALQKLQGQIPAAEAAAQKNKAGR